jgi:hypothetical protein
MKNKLSIQPGDHAKIIFNGQPKELEVVDIISDKNVEDKNLCFSLNLQDVCNQKYLDFIELTLPGGQIITCRPIQPLF